MEENFLFLNFEGLDDSQVKHLNGILNPSNLNPAIEFPWNNLVVEENIVKGTSSSLNVHAPAFEAHSSKIPNHALVSDSYCSPTVTFNNSNQILNNTVPLVSYPHEYSTLNSRILNVPQNYANGSMNQHAYNTYNQTVIYTEPAKTVTDSVPSPAQPTLVYTPTNTFKLNPTVSCFVPSNFHNQILTCNKPISNVEQSSNTHKDSENEECVEQSVVQLKEQSVVQLKQQPVVQLKEQPVVQFKEQPVVQFKEQPVVQFKEQPVVQFKEQPVVQFKEQPVVQFKEQPVVKNDVVPNDSLKVNGLDAKEEIDSKKAEISTNAAETVKLEQPSAPPAPRSWADIVSKGPSSAGKTQLANSKSSVIPNGNKSVKVTTKDPDVESLSIEEDKYSLILGKHLYSYDLHFEPVFLQPRGLINRRNWCYINATLQALLGCPPFYTLLRSLPYLEELDRGKSVTPIIDSMFKVAQEFTKFDSPREELQPGSPFQPDFIYDMLRDLKSDCLKGQQEDAEEFLSFILNGMHEEMVKIIKNYERKNDISLSSERKENGDASESEEDWTVIGSKNKGMVTRKVAEHKTPISDLLGGQIKSFLTTSGNKTSASIQPFFTLQLDIQSDKVNSVSEALKEMTVKEPIQGYTCAKTKQEVEAYSHVALQKLPPILILHLKRFVYNKTGGCKKVMKKTDYPVELELNKDLFSSDVKKSHKMRVYRLFAVMYHDGEEAVKGHYISDVYNYGSQTWVRCDDRTITAVSEAQVLSHSPPRVPYLLFYQES